MTAYFLEREYRRAVKKTDRAKTLRKALRKKHLTYKSQSIHDYRGSSGLLPVRVCGVFIIIIHNHEFTPDFFHR